MRHPPRASLLFILVWTYHAWASAQVVIPAIVTDLGGHPVSGLQKTDFSLESKDHVQLEDVEEVLPLAAGTSVPVFILYDAASMAGPDQKKTHTELLELLSRAAREHDPITLILRSSKGLELIHDMTTDPAVFSAAINRALPDKSKSASDREGQSKAEGPKFASEVLAEAARLQELIQSHPDVRFKPWFSAALDELGGIQKMAELMQGSKKRKVLIWIGNCCSSLMFDNGEIIDGRNRGPGLASDRESRKMAVHSIPVAYEKMINAVNSSRFSVYVYSMPVAHQQMMDASLEYLPQGGLMEELARRTGGTYVGASPTLESAIAEARKDLGPYYLFRVSVNSTSKAPTPVKLKIKVDRPDVRIRSSDGFLDLGH